MWSLGRQTVLPCDDHKLPRMVPPRIPAGIICLPMFFLIFLRRFDEIVIEFFCSSQPTKDIEEVPDIIGPLQSQLHSVDDD